jgi:hypothetical protein
MKTQQAAEEYVSFPFFMSVTHLNKAVLRISYDINMVSYSIGLQSSPIMLQKPPIIIAFSLYTWSLLAAVN